MRKKVCVALVLFMFCALCLGGLAEAAPQADQVGAGKMYADSVGQALGKAAYGIKGTIDRKQLAGDIYEYSLILTVGAGAHDRIGLHRVVMEQAPWTPVSTGNAVMMIHGDTCSFDIAFATPSPSQQSLAIYLAQQGVDVWGIDLRWVLAPDNTTDFSFMQDWDTALHLSDIKKAVLVCRALRALSGDGPGKIIMLGHSRGAQLVYAYANQEAPLPAASQDLKGIIPMDMYYKLDPSDPGAQALKQAAQTRYATLKALSQSGTYYSNEGATLKGLTSLAAADPNGTSPVNPPLTNLQVALGALSATYALATPQMPACTPFYHYLAGAFDPVTHLPTGLQFADQEYVVSLGMATPSFQSLGEQIDGEAIISDMPVPYDDNLGQIKVPVFYVGAGGGMGQYGAYTTTLLGSSDKEVLIVSTFPGMPVLDYGHADLLWADNAKDLVWKPIAEWIDTLEVAVTGVTLDKETDTIAMGETGQLTATITPENAHNQNVTWSSDNTAVATVSSTGLVTAVAEGTAHITVTTADGGFTATCAVTVIKPSNPGVESFPLLSAPPSYFEQLLSALG